MQAANPSIEENDIPEMEIELDLLDKLKERIKVARQIDQAQHKVKKDNYDRNWMKETAEAMELELDSDYLRQATILNSAHWTN